MWGTCLGFENLAMFASDDPDTVLEGGFDSDDATYNIEFMVPPSKSKIFSRLGDSALVL